MNNEASIYASSHSVSPYPTPLCDNRIIRVHNTSVAGWRGGSCDELSCILSVASSEDNGCYGQPIIVSQVSCCFVSH
jgi:hypothetical protein